MFCGRETADMFINMKQFGQFIDKLKLVEERVKDLDVDLTFVKENNNDRLMAHLTELLTCGTFDPEMEIHTFESPVEDFLAQAAITCKIFKKQQFGLQRAIRDIKSIRTEMRETRRFFESSFEMLLRTR